MVDGESGARVVSAGYQSIGQAVSQPLAMGDCLELELSLRWVSGATDAPGGQIDSDGCDTPCSIPIPLQWNTTGEWIDTEVVITNLHDRATFRFSVNSQAAMAQTFDIDAASLKVVPCE